MMVELAKQYMNIDAAGKAALVEYYNAHCVALVKRERRYKMKSGDNWCAMFTSVIAHKLGIPVNKFPYEVSVGEQVKIAKSYGYYTQNMEKAKSGDLIIFNWNGDSWPDHVGVIQNIKDGIITTVEGNYHGTVGERHISMKSNYIMGVIQL